MLEQLPLPAPKAQSIVIDSYPIDSFGGFTTNKRLYGKLHWVGGLELESDDPRFGGFSGLTFLDAHSFLAIGDKGTIVTGRLQQKDGRPAAVHSASMRFLPGLSERLKSWRRDAEGLARSGSSLYVSFEGDTRLVRYDLSDTRLVGTQERISLPKVVRAGTHANNGLEALAIVPEGHPYAGGFLLMSEKLAADKIQGWILKDGKVIAFTLPEQGGLSVTDADFTASGDLIILERKLSLLGGLQIRIRRVRAQDLRAGHIAKTDHLLTGNLSNALDNMEGIDSQPQPDGSSLITLISDDNFNPLQRTLLLQFLLPAGQ